MDLPRARVAHAAENGLVRPLWVFDLDGTLIGSIRSDVLRPGTVELLEALESAGCVSALWSAGGEEYARRAAERHGIAMWFADFAGKSGRDTTGRYHSPTFEVARVEELCVSPERIYVDDMPLEVPIDGVAVGVRQFMGGNAFDNELADLQAEIHSVVAACADGDA